MAEYEIITMELDNTIEEENIYYNCTECASLIEILLIKEENGFIEFQCLNKKCHIRRNIPIKVLQK